MGHFAKKAKYIQISKSVDSGTSLVDPMSLLDIIDNSTAYLLIVSFSRLTVWVVWVVLVV